MKLEPSKRSYDLGLGELLLIVVETVNDDFNIGGLICKPHFKQANFKLIGS